MVHPCYGPSVAEERIFEDKVLGRWAYDLTWAMVGGASRPIGGCIHSLDEPPRAWSRRVLRAIEVHEGERRAQEMRREASRLARTPLADTLERVAEAQPRGGVRRGGRPPVSDELLRLVAGIHRAAPSGRAATAALAREFPYLATSTLRKYVRLAHTRTDPATGRPFLEPPKGRED